MHALLYHWPVICVGNAVQKISNNPKNGRIVQRITLNRLSVWCNKCFPLYGCKVQLSTERNEHRVANLRLSGNVDDCVTLRGFDGAAVAVITADTGN